MILFEIHFCVKKRARLCLVLCQKSKKIWKNWFMQTGNTKSGN